MPAEEVSFGCGVYTHVAHMQHATIMVHFRRSGALPIVSVTTLAMVVMVVMAS